MKGMVNSALFTVLHNAHSNKSRIKICPESVCICGYYENLVFHIGCN